MGNTITNILPFTGFVKVEGGTFTMGAFKKQITVPDFYMAVYPVTQAFYKEIMNTNPSEFKGKNHPVTNVSWDEIHAKNGFLEKINQNEAIKKEVAENLNGIKTNEILFSLPTETEWEYAARGGKHNSPFEYAGSDDINEVAWYEGNSPKSTMPVGLKAPNKLGIYDLSGNVWEWCEDLWSNEAKDIPEDGTANAEKGAYRVLRGGSYFRHPDLCSVSLRSTYHPSSLNNCIGFRLVFSFQGK